MLSAEIDRYPPQIPLQMCAPQIVSGVNPGVPLHPNAHLHYPQIPGVPQGLSRYPSQPGPQQNPQGPQADAPNGNPNVTGPGQVPGIDQSQQDSVNSSMTLSVNSSFQQQAHNNNSMEDAMNAGGGGSAGNVISGGKGLSSSTERDEGHRRQVNNKGRSFGAPGQAAERNYGANENRNYGANENRNYGAPGNNVAAMNGSGMQANSAQGAHYRWKKRAAPLEHGAAKSRNPYGL